MWVKEGKSHPSIGTRDKTPGFGTEQRLECLKQQAMCIGGRTFPPMVFPGFTVLACSPFGIRCMRALETFSRPSLSILFISMLQFRIC